MWVVSVSTLFANVFIQKKPFERATFNAAQITITMWVAGLVIQVAVAAFFVGLQHGKLVELAP